MRKVLLAALALLTLTATVQAAITVPTFGAKTTSSTTDFRPTLLNLDSTGAWIGRVDRNSNDNVLADDCFYLRFGANTAAVNLAAGDVRIGGGDATVCAPAILTSSSSEVQSATPLVDLDELLTLTDIRSVIKYIEVDGVQGFTNGDLPVVDLGNANTPTGCATSAVGTFDVCDIRLRTISLAYGTLVKTGEADLTASATVDGTLPDTATLTDFTDADLTFRYFDANQNRVFDSGDSLYLRFGGNDATTQVHNGGHGAFVPQSVDLRLTAFGSNSAGTFVAAGNTDHVPTLDTAPTITVLRNGATAGTDRLFIHFGAGTTTVQMGDIALNTVTGQTAGAMMTTAALGVGLGGTTSAFSTGIFTVDANGNGRYDDADGLYWDLPAAFGGDATAGKLSTFDVRLKAVTVNSGTYAAGTNVAATDTDRVAFVAQGSAVTGLTLKFFDADRGQPLQALRNLNNAKVTGADGVLDSIAEASYVESTAAVTVSSVRIAAISLGAGAATAVAAGNADINNVGGALTLLANFKFKDADTGGALDFDAGECAYISTDGFVSAGDTRVTTCGAFAPGTTVATADADCLTCSTVASSVIIDTTFNDYVTGPDATFTTGSDFVYIDNDVTTNVGVGVGVGLIRVVAISYTAGSTVANCAATVKDADCGSALLALTNAKVTGSDGSWTSGTEWVYVSADHAIDATEKRVTAATLNTFTAAAASAVAAGDADLPGSNVGTGDALYISASAITGAATASTIPLMGDIRLLHPSLAYGTVVSATNADYTPRWVTVTDSQATAPGSLLRWDRGSTGTISDDTFWLRVGTATTATPLPGDVRLLPSINSIVAGTQFSSGDSDSSATLVRDTSLDAVAGTPDPGLGDGILAMICFVNAGGSTYAGYDSNDFVYVDNTAAGGGGTLTINDIRLAPITGLSTAYAAGTMVTNSDADRLAFTTCTSHTTLGAGTGLQGSRSWRLKILDQDYDAAFDPGGTDNQRIEHILLSADGDDAAGDPCNTFNGNGVGTPGCSVIQLMGDIPLTGAATSVTPPPPPPGGGGGSTTTTTTTSSTSSTTSTTSTTSATSSSSSTSATTSVPVEEATQIVADANVNLEAEIVVTKDGDNNIVTWPAQTGVSGYQLWRHTSPWALVAELPASAVTYTDENAPDGAVYSVTAFLDDAGTITGILTSAQMNAGEVPGIDAVPEGSKNSKKSGPIPGFELPLALLAVAAVALAMARRRNA